MTPEQKATEFLATQTHMVVAVTREDGLSWAVPVTIQRREGREFEWDSGFDTVHSQAIDRDPRVAICLYRTSSDDREELVVYGDATVEIVDRHDKYARYRATLQTAWINGKDHVKRALDVSQL